MKTIVLTALAIMVMAPLALPAEQVDHVSQYGITWNFDKPYAVGRFITGDWWVLGPVTVVSVTPAPGPVQGKQDLADAKSRYGAAAMVGDSRMRNGSMIVTRPSSKQGYDSRLINYDPDLSVRFPCSLGVSQSLISTISNDDPHVANLAKPLMWKSEQDAILALKTAAVLTCIDKAPPDDAFRPPYVGGPAPIHRFKDIRWDLLPRLKAPPSMPAWSTVERFVQRPWLDHTEAWLLQFTGPGENNPIYGREFSRITNIASLMCMLDVPKEQKEKTLVGLIQIGIDFRGLADTGRQWTGDGGHWSGRKWPILFAGLMLGNKDLQSLPPHDKTIFAEDQQTYYGHGWAGQTALFQMVFHTFPHDPYEEKSPDKWTAEDKKSEGYRMVNGSCWPGTALAVLLMKAKPLWQQDAFFDYCDRWMSKDDPYAAARGQFHRPANEGKTVDRFVDEMWALYRQNVPQQGDAGQSVKWVWDDLKTHKGKFVADNRQ